MDYSQVTIVRCTQEQKTQTSRNTYKLWGAGLGFEEQGWVDRFSALEHDEWAEGDRHVHWALVRRDDPGAIEMLAHCETFRRVSIIAKSGAKDPQEVTSYGIAGVFTPPSNRGKGYARQLLRLLHYVMAPDSLLPPFPSHWGTEPDIEGLKDAEFSVLYSGVGDKYYASCRQGDGPSSQAGWIRQKIAARTWEVPSTDENDCSQEGREWLDSKSLVDLEAATAKEMRRTLGDSDVGRYRFAILPSWSLFRIHALRSEISPAGKKYPGRPYGLLLPTTEHSTQRPFITFTYPEAESSPPVLHITYVHHPVPFDAVLAAARKAGCGKISMWGGRGGWDDHKPQIDHDAEMPCYVVYGQNSEECEWKWAEQYTWC